MAAERPTGRGQGSARPKRGAAREAEATPTAAPERRFVDIDPWAVLLEGLMNDAGGGAGRAQARQAGVGQGTTGERADGDEPHPAARDAGGLGRPDGKSYLVRCSTVALWGPGCEEAEPQGPTSPLQASRQEREGAGRRSRLPDV